MMNWDWFIYFAVLSVVLWTAGSWNAFKGSQSKACVFTILVLFLFAIGRTDNLCQMEIQMDSVFQYHTVGGIHLRQPAQA